MFNESSVILFIKKQKKQNKMVRNFNVNGETQRRIKSKRKRILKQSERRTVNTLVNTTPNDGVAV